MYRNAPPWRMNLPRTSPHGSGLLGGLQPGRQAGGDGQWGRHRQVWDVATGEELHTLAGHTDAVNSAAFSPDGKLVVTASGDNTAKVWDVATGENCTPWPATRIGSTRRPSARTASWWSTASEDSTAKVWDVATGEEVHTLAGHTDWVISAAFSPDGTLVVTASDDSTARLWDVATGEEMSHPGWPHGCGHFGGLQPGRQTGGDGQWRQHRQGVGRGDGRRSAHPGRPHG